MRNVWSYMAKPMSVVNYSIPMGILLYVQPAHSFVNPSGGIFVRNVYILMTV